MKNKVRSGCCETDEIALHECHFWDTSLNDRCEERLQPSNMINDHIHRVAHPRRVDHGGKVSHVEHCVEFGIDSVPFIISYLRNPVYSCIHRTFEVASLLLPHNNWSVASQFVHEHDNIVQTRCGIVVFEYWCNLTMLNNSRLTYCSHILLTWKISLAVFGCWCCFDSQIYQDTPNTCNYMLRYVKKALSRKISAKAIVFDEYWLNPPMKAENTFLFL